MSKAPRVDEPRTPYQPYGWVPLGDSPQVPSSYQEDFIDLLPLGGAGSNKDKSGGARPRNAIVQLLLEILIVLVGAAVLAVALRAFVVQVYNIPSGSMESTLDVGSRIAVNRLPKLGKELERGDVVVFRDDKDWIGAPEDTGFNPVRSFLEFLGLSSPSGEQVLVKRVIGVGGDTVSCCSPDGDLMVNGTAVKEPYIKEGTGTAVPFEVKVPEGSYWVMGDNRSNSADSLYHYQRDEDPFVDKDSVIGRALARIWPLNTWATLDDRDVFSGVGDG